MDIEIYRLLRMYVKYSPWPETTLKSPAGQDQASQGRSTFEPHLKTFRV